MPNTICVGAQWGDEGKGKIVDVLTESADIVVRTQGGNNAGHTVITGKKKYVLHLVPSGILHRGKTCVIANGVVIDPIGLVSEIEGLRDQKIRVGRNFIISDAAHVVFPYHRTIDAAKEKAKGKKKIGTTNRGIGPTYADKVDRTGLRMCDLMDPEDFAVKLKAKLREVNKVLKFHGEKPASFKKIYDEYLVAMETLRPFVRNTVVYMHEAVKAGKMILFEGAQGTFLDLDHGTYPYVTSSNTTSGGAATGSGIPPHWMDKVLGVMKAYTTRVGEGPFPTEDDEIGDMLHGMGREFGATTGRARRCGWLDLVSIRYAAMVNGIDEIAVTNIDGLDGLKTLKLCVAYKLDGKTINYPPTDTAALARCTPIYLEVPGWNKDTTGATTYKELPAKTRAYLKKVCELTGTKLSIASVGPHRKETIIL